MTKTLTVKELRDMLSWYDENDTVDIMAYIVDADYDLVGLEVEVDGEVIIRDDEYPQ